MIWRGNRFLLDEGRESIINSGILFLSFYFFLLSHLLPFSLASRLFLTWIQTAFFCGLWLMRLSCLVKASFFFLTESLLNAFHHRLNSKVFSLKIIPNLPLISLQLPLISNNISEHGSLIPQILLHPHQSILQNLIIFKSILPLSDLLLNPDVLLIHLVHLFFLPSSHVLDPLRIPLR